jgi:hypothetical protein
VYYLVILGVVWITTKNKEATQRQRVAVACTTSQNAIALLIAAGWDMRADEMTPIIPTMNQLSECDFTFFETDWRTTPEYSLEQVGPTTFTGKTGWISFTITFRDAAKVNVGCLTPMNYWRPPPTSSSGDPEPDPSTTTNSTDAGVASGRRQRRLLLADVRKSLQNTPGGGRHQTVT